ncbi:MAG TPA: porin [Longimicrobiaceae bacterium]|nr:porin [Longimicrobiaceae bacterium]
MPIPTRRSRAPLPGRPPALAGALLLLAGAAGAQEAPPVLFRANALEVSVGGRVQTQLNTTSVDTEPFSEIVLRRVRLEAAVKVNEVVSAKIQPEYAGSRVTVKDAWVRFSLDPALSLVAGQANRPFGIVTPTSSTRILPIERGVRIRGLPGAADQHNLVAELGYADRDVGLQLTGEPEGAPLGFSYAAGVFNGPARGEARELNTYQLAARAAVRPLAPLRLGASWSRRDFALPAGGSPDALEVERGHAWALDAEWGRYGPGLHLLGELSLGDLDPATGAEFVGAQGWLAYRTGAVGRALTGVEPLLRVSHGEVDGASDRLAVTGGTLLTPGINLYLGPLNRVMLNYDLWTPDGGGGREGSFRAQFQAAF